MVTQVKIYAPSSTANLGPGFDVFGLALDAFFDEIWMIKKEKGITIISSDNILSSKILSKCFSYESPK